MREDNYIDLGLPSGTLWSTCNVGAESIVDCGKYFNHREALNCGFTLPTKKQFEELVEDTTYVWVENYNNCGVNGGLFIGKNGNEVFLPASGYRLHESTYAIDYSGSYWSSTFDPKKNYFKYLHFCNGIVAWQDSNTERLAFPLRSVKNK